MRNFKDFTRAIAGIATTLKGINTIVDAIPVPGGGGTGVLDYSFDEQDTGRKWVDGKTIYSKTIYNPDSTSTQFNFTVPTEIENLIECKFIYIQTGSYPGITIVYDAASRIATAGSLTGGVQGTAAADGRYMYIEYTKTSE